MGYIPLYGIYVNPKIKIPETFSRFLPKIPLGFNYPYDL
jgi:hypothetical protein